MRVMPADPPAPGADQIDAPRPRRTPRQGDIALREVHMHLHSPADPAEAVCTSNERCTQRKSAHFVRHVAFDVSGTRLEGAFCAGQSFGVLPPGLDASARPHKLRLYSIASPTSGEDGAGRVVATTVKRTIDEHHETGRLFLGVASNYLCDLKPGDRVKLTGPSGKRFVLPAAPEQHDYLFFATGTGIAPFRGMLMELLGQAPGRRGVPVNSRIVLVMGAAYATDLLYHGDLLRMEQEHAKFTYLTAISRERQADGHDPLYVQDRLMSHRDLLLPILESPRTLVYICGLAGMELGIFQRMASLLPDHALEPYLKVDPEAMGDIRSWQRAMLHKQVRPSRRVFVEVY
jgi:ferredoxin--NADP+ reductase